MSERWNDLIASSICCVIMALCVIVLAFGVGFGFAFGFFLAGRMKRRSFHCQQIESGDRRRCENLEYKFCPYASKVCLECTGSVIITVVLYA